MDLIYMNSNMEDIGVLRDYEMDLAFGTDENNFECQISAASHCCEGGYFLYFEGTEYGGIIDGVEIDTALNEVTYSGRTWQGILNAKVLCPDDGKDYLVVSGEANAVLSSLLSRFSLTDLFEADTANSGITISKYQMYRYITGYDGIVKMLNSANAKLKVKFDGRKVILSAVKKQDYSQNEEFDSDLMDFRIKKKAKTVNHLICLGKGELADRTVVHLYADAEGNISQTQTQFGVDEYTAVYNYSSVETEEELIRSGTEQLEALWEQDEVSADFGADSDAYDVGDTVGAYDNITGLYISTEIKKKIVTIKNGQITVSLVTDTATASSTPIGGGGGTGSGGGSGNLDAHISDTNNPHQVTIEQIGAAPAGYGLGELPASPADLNDRIETGYFRITSSVLNYPFTHGAGHVRRYNTQESVQNIVQSNTGNEMIRYTTDGGATWIEEWVNPPMTLGVEYRTTERHKGKAVYVTRLTVGELLNKGTTSTTLPSTPAEIVEIYGTAKSDAYTETVTFPIITSAGAVGARMAKEATKSITVRTYADYSGYIATATVKYTKG